MDAAQDQERGAAPGPGDPAPAFDLPATGSRRATLAAHRGHPVIVYFYPKADTPGCTGEACTFEERLPDLARLGATVIGISRDPMRALEAFAGKHRLTFPLASDEDGAICRAYGVWQRKSMYGRTYDGIERSTFLVGPEGEIRAAWRKVKLKGHVEAVLRALG